MSILYKSSSGKEVKAHSYSGGSEFKFCRRKYKLHRLDGWQEKSRKAAPEFGKAIESAIQYFHENGSKKSDCADSFKGIWIKFQDVDMAYTDADGDWASLYTAGSELCSLYELLIPDLPIRNPKFQLEYRKEVFAGSGLEFLSYVDMLSTSENGFRTVVDIKTARNPLTLDRNMLSLDPQLRRYAWVTGIQDVAFLWLIKAKPHSFKKNDTITLLDNVGSWKAGQEVCVYKFVDKTEESPAQITIGTTEAFQDLEKLLAEIKGKGSSEAKDKTVSDFVASGRMATVLRDQVTKTRIQFITAHIQDEELPEIGNTIGHEIVSIRDAGDKSLWSKDGGVRFPNNQCVWCSYRGICTNNPSLRDDLLVQIGGTTPERDWLDDLVEED